MLAIVLVVVAVAATAQPSAAQVIAVPAFPIGSHPPVDWSLPPEVFDVGAGGDGGFAVGWMEVHPKGNHTEQAIVTAPFTASGVPQQPPLRSLASEIFKPTLSIAGLLSGYSIALPVELPSLYTELHARFYGLDGAFRSSHKVIDAPIARDIASAGLLSGTAFAWVDTTDTSVLKVTVWDNFGRSRGVIYGPPSEALW
jgi:hypothetical protein